MAASFLSAAEPPGFHSWLKWRSLCTRLGRLTRPSCTRFPDDSPAIDDEARIPIGLADRNCSLCACSGTACRSEPRAGGQGDTAAGAGAGSLSKPDDRISVAELRTGV